jgi:4-diphosphocytidyl-2-C-methyl-D-erythritol kinase
MIRVFAPAKINLTLKVGAPRADGLHPLASVVAFADVGDWIEASPADALSLRIVGPFAASLEASDDNLVIRAARALQSAANVSIGAALTLDKHLPIASGIGGGSSDAAAALKALNALWTLNLSEAALMQIARGLGADVPVCVAARAAYMTGIGEIVEPIVLPKLNAVLVNPLFPVPTGAVYAAFDALGLGQSFATAPPPSWIDAASAIAGAAQLGNDLYQPACKVAPALTDVSNILRGNPDARHVALSGSGGTVFALVDDEAAADRLTRAVERPGWWVRKAALG